MPLSASPGRTSTLLAAGLIVLFGSLLTISKPASLICLTAGLALMATWMWNASDTTMVRTFGLIRIPPFRTAVGVIAAVATGTLLRLIQAHTLYPWPPRPFLIISMSIGATEELVFRGFFLGRFLDWWRPVMAVTTAALFHAAYKTALFIPSSPISELATLGGVTFAFGLLLGSWRVKTGSVWPCIMFHALFDLWVYGDRMTPWWVW